MHFDTPSFLCCISLGKKRKIPRLSLFRASGGFPKYRRGSVLFLDIYQFYFKNQSRERFDFTSFLCTVSQFLRNIQFPFRTYRHHLQCFSPSAEPVLARYVKLIITETNNDTGVCQVSYFKAYGKI